MLNRILYLLVFVFVFTNSCNTKSNNTSSYQENLQEFIDLRFGMFLCYNIMSYGAGWGESNYTISTFNPVDLNCSQWAKSAKSANMKFGLLTTKHHEGFCLWDSEVTEYDIANTPYKKDIVEQYVEAFRKHDLKIGLYYSIWDSTHGIDKGNIGEEQLDFIKTQIRELLSKYGKIDYFVIDGWFWRMGHREVPYIEIRELIRELQPQCLLTDHTHLQAPYHVDIPYFEGPFGAYPSKNNKMPSALGHCSFEGNGWFWNEETPKGLKKGETKEKIIENLLTLESRYCNFMLNCMPNRMGLLDTVTVDLLNSIGKEWTPNNNRPKLSFYEKRLIYSAPIINATASSGIPFNLIDASQYGTDYKHWFSDSTKNQTIVLDMGGSYDNINVITLIPNHRCKPAPETVLSKGNISELRTYISLDNLTYTLVSNNKWPLNDEYRVILFPETKARYIKLEILGYSGSEAIIAEIDVGSSTSLPKKLDLK